METLTFRESLENSEFSILNSATPIVLFKGHYFPLSFVFPTVKYINWEMGYMVDKGRIIASLEASKYIRNMDWFPEHYVLSKLN